jgi:hypothetical protein
MHAMEGDSTPNISFEHKVPNYNGPQWIPDIMQLNKQILEVENDSKVA